MLFLRKFFWMLPAILNWHIRIILSQYARIPIEKVEMGCEEIMETLVDDYRQYFKKKCDFLLQESEQIYLLSYTPQPLALRLSDYLNFDGVYSSEIKPNDDTVFEKHHVIAQFKKKFPDHKIVYIVDDLVDLKCLKMVHKGFLYNSSYFTRSYCKLFHKKIEIIK